MLVVSELDFDVEILSQVYSLLGLVFHIFLSQVLSRIINPRSYPMSRIPGLIPGGLFKISERDNLKNWNSKFEITLS